MAFGISDMMINQLEDMDETRAPQDVDVFNKVMDETMVKRKTFKEEML